MRVNVSECGRKEVKHGGSEKKKGKEKEEDESREKKGQKENVITRFRGYDIINSDVRSEFMICRQCS